ncbi:MAG: GAF domain-containing protein, partial [Gemmatimonadaceae bacterium]
MSRRSLEWWIGIVRLLAIPFAVLQVALTANYPRGDEQIAWILTAILAAGALVLFAGVRHADVPGFQLAATAFDFGIVAAFAVLFAFEPGTPTRQLLFLAIVLGAARFGMPGGFVVALAAIPVSAWFEIRRSDVFHQRFHSDYVTFQAGAGLLMALLVGWLYDRLTEQNATAEQRADEAELLRDELGRRADLLEAATRCARALSSSLDLDEAFGAFIRELRGLVPFDRMAIVLAEGDVSRVIATAGASANAVEPPGSESSLENNLVAEIVASGQTVYRADMSQQQYAEEAWLLNLGIHSRVAAPLLSGARAIGLISVGRVDAHAFSEPEIELVSLLGRLAASAVQNIRAYESERRTV